MQNLSLKTFRFILTIGLVLTTFLSFSQVRSSLIGGNDITHLEASLSKKELLQQIKDSLEAIKYKAIASGNQALQARCLFDLLRIRDLRTEDSLYFRNSAFMDTILNDRSSPVKLKALVYILHAQRLHLFSQRYLKFNEAAYRTPDLYGNYAALSLTQRDSIIASDLSAAFKLSPFEGDRSDLLWLSTNPDVFLFKPTFQDIVLSESVNLTANHYEDYYIETKRMATWASLPSAAFRKVLDSLAGASGIGKVFKAYKTWIDYNKNDVATNEFIETLARKYMFLARTADSTARDAYIGYLAEKSSSPYAPVRAHAVYQLCLQWNELGREYVDFEDRYKFLSGNNFEIKYQYFPKKALDLYEQNKQLLAGYPVLNRILILMERQLLSRGIKVEMQDKFIPDEPIPIKAIYKNAKAFNFSVVPAAGISDQRLPSVKVLLAKKPVEAGTYTLPLPDDDNSHATYLKLAPLTKGSYYLLFSHQPLESSADSIYRIRFQVTSIAAINTDERVYVLDRKTGRPLSGAMIQLRKKNTTAGGDAIKVNEAGYATIPLSKADSIIIAYKGDTLGQDFNAQINSVSDDENIYDKSNYDSLDDFYDDKLKMHLFTDRAVYRPGQTVFYKIIFLTRDPRTGQEILFNRQNIGTEFFRNRLTKWIKDNEALIKLRDPFQRTVDSAKVLINDFGSFAGSFVLPAAAATGRWQIDGEPDEDHANNGSFEVEEYKRPTIEMAMEKQTKMLLPGQPFTIKLKLRSFTGADLGNIPITYRIMRYGETPGKTGSFGNYEDTKLIDTIGLTDKNGILLIKVNDSVLAKYLIEKDHRYNYSYSIIAKAVDMTGESSEITDRIRVSSQPVVIRINLDKIYDRNKIPALTVKTTNEYEGELGQLVNIKIYQVSNPDATASKEVDQWYYDRTDWNNWFPLLAEIEKRPEKIRTLVLDTMINTGLYQKLMLPASKLNAGFYELEANCFEKENLIGKSKFSFKVYDSEKNETPVTDIDYLPFNSVKPGDKIIWYSSGKQAAYTIYQTLFVTRKNRKVINNIYQELDEQKGIRKWTFRVPLDADGDILLNRISIHDNLLDRHQQRIYINKTAAESPQIIVESYRKVMTPGTKETFTVSVKTKNDNIAAELMTTMYDASLDKIEQHEWDLPGLDYDRDYLSTEWGYRLTSTIQSGKAGEIEPYPLGDILKSPGNTSVAYGVTDKVAGLSISDGSGLQEVVVVGYGTQKMKAISAVKGITLRGYTSLKDYKQPLIVLDGVVYNGQISALDPGAITDIMILKGSDAAAIYGSSGSQGVLIISTKGPIVLPGSEEPVIKIRKNFNETAFFFPQVHASPDGFYRFSFTIPETASEWNWRLFAHTKDARFAYLETKLQTQLNLLVQPNMPRFLYQGDRLKLQSRISNLDTAAVFGTASIKVENAVTGQDMTTSMVKQSIKSFSLDQKSSGATGFELKVPDELTDPIKIVVSVTGQGVADAEEHIIPILSKRIFTRQTVPVVFSGSNPSISIPAIQLPGNSSLYGIGFTIQQKPQASLINALPWLANYSYDCAEQTFNKLRAEVTAVRLMQRDSNVRKAFAKVSRKTETEQMSADKLPDELPGESIPWLDLTNKVAKQQKQLYQLLETSDTKFNIGTRLERLYKLQQPDGGLSWFEGGKSSEYISSYILAGFGQLKQQGWKPKQNMANQFQQFITNLFSYNANLVKSAKAENYDLFKLYGLSFWTDLGDASLNAKESSWLDLAWTNVASLDLANLALLVVSTCRLEKKDNILYQKALHQLENIRQEAITDPENGTRWKAVADAEDMESSSEETIALLNEAFSFGNDHKAISAGILQWLLTTKQDQHWQTTKGTAAAIGILEQQKGNTFGADQSISGVLNNKTLTVSNDLLSGIPESFVQSATLPTQITLQQKGSDTKGALTWYYFTDNNRLDTLNKAVKISRKYYRNDHNKGWTELKDTSVLKIGEQIHVILSIETSRQLKFVQITDPRAAAFEPKESESGYRYEQGISYYQSIKDTGLDLFTESVPRGVSTIEYDLTVAMGGTFSNGPVKLQCMYQSGVTAYSGVVGFVAE